MLVPCAQAADTKEALAARLQQATTETSLDSEGVAPWHLKLDVQLFDEQGKPAEQGTIETWWINPKQVLTIYKTPSYAATEVLSSSGLLRTKSSGAPPALLSLVLKQVVHPMPEQDSTTQTVPDLRKQTFGKIPLDCIMLDQHITGVAYPPLGLFPTYCFDPGKTFLRVSYDYGSEIVIRNAMGGFLGRHVATQLSVSENSLNVISAHVMTLESKSTLVPPPYNEAGLESPGHPVTVAPSAVAGSLLVKPEPIYPQIAKERRVSGTVQIHAIIGPRWPSQIHEAH